MANSADPDQTAPKEQSDQGIHYVCSDFFPNTYACIDISFLLVPTERNVLKLFS